MFANSISNLYTKRLPQNIYQESVRCTSVALCAVGTSVSLHTSVPSVTPCAYYLRLLVYHPIFRNLSKLSSLTKGHTEKRRGRRIIKTKQWKSRRHHRRTEQRSLFANSISNLYTKRLPQNIYQESVHCTSVALCAVGTSVSLHTSVPSVTPCAYYIRLLVYHSIFRKNLEY